MNFKKIFFSFLLICGFAPTVQAGILQAIEYNDLEAMKAAYNQNPSTFVEPFLDNNVLEIISPIHKAAMTARDPKVLNLLLNFGANINKRSESGKTPLFYALKYNPNPEIALFLINQGADTNARDNFGKHVFLSVNEPEVYRSNIERAAILTAMMHHGLDLSNLFSVNQNNTANTSAIERVTTPTVERIISRENVQLLTDEDICGVCLNSIKELAESNVTVYKTACCKQFLCKNCTDNIVGSGRLISCPFCRRKGLDLDFVQVNINPETQEVTATTLL